jgi:hypothetical protein
MVIVLVIVLVIISRSRTIAMLSGFTPVAVLKPGTNHELCHCADDVTPVAVLKPSRRV